MKAPRTGAQRQAAHKARMQAAGLVRVAVWVYPEDAKWMRATAALWVTNHVRKRPQPDAKIVQLTMSENG